MTKKAVLCQSPIHRDTHFYLLSNRLLSCNSRRCVNPLSIGTPISTQKSIEKERNFICVNPLSIGTPISTVKMLLIVKLQHFCVNPLSIGTPISTMVMSCLNRTANEKCVNPLSIGTPISTGCDQQRQGHRNSLCQSPIHRDTHFYGMDIALFYNKVFELCQSPIHRDTHFYRVQRLFEGRGNRPVSIPYPSGHPFLPSPPKLLDFMRLPSLDFAGIYQTILIKGIFLGF